MAAAGLWITLGREACQPGLRYSNQYCVCSLWGLRWEEEIFGKFQLLLVQGMLPERQVYCMFLPETNPDFKKWECCFIYFCILQKSGFFKIGFIRQFLLIQLLTILAQVFLSLRLWPLIIIHFKSSKLNYYSIHLDVLQVCMATATSMSCTLTRGWHQVQLRVCLFQRP